MSAPEKSSRAAGISAAASPDPGRRGKNLWRRLLATDPRRADAEDSASNTPEPPVSTFPALVADLRRLRWTDDADVTLDGWSYLPTAVGKPATVHVFATVAGTNHRWHAEVQQRVDPEVGAFSSRSENLADKAWTATFPGAALAALLRQPGAEPQSQGPGGTTWTLPVWVELDFGTHRQRSPFSSQYRWGSAIGLPGRVLDGSLWTSASWHDGSGLVFCVRTDCVVGIGIGLVAAEVQLRLAALGAAGLRRVHVGAAAGEDFVWPPGQAQGMLPIAGSKLTAKGSDPVSWTADDGSRHPVLATQPQLSLAELPTVAVTGSGTVDGRLLVHRRHRLAQVHDVQLTTGPEPTLRVQGAVAGAWQGSVTVELRGKPGRLQATTGLVDGRFSVEVPMLHTDPWGNAGLAPPPGGYRLWVGDADGAEIAVLGQALAGRLYTWPVTEQFNARLEQHPEGGLWVMVNDSRTLTEIGPAARRQLRARYAQPGPDSVVEEAIYFESFDGLVCACNPKAVYDEVRRRDLGLQLYWGVKDRSVPAPEGSIPITINSAEWWRVRHQARYLVANNWVHDTWTRHPHQKVLQTWHGTAFKLLALDRPHARHDTGFVAAVRAEREKWDLLLAENDYSVAQMRQAYDYPGPILTSGYPRNDLLSSPAAEQVRERVRSRLGIAPEQRAVLYAPTWRDDREAMVDHLDLPRLAAELGEGFVILARGHSRNLRTTAAQDSDRVLDVTSYPEVTDLFCAADVCVTDYSSVMFDFTVTGKPLLFFAPDYDRYVGRDRGSYFDLREVAPGPVLSGLTETAEAIADAAVVRQRWDARYRDWVSRFNAWDDGHASARAVDALLAL